MGFDQRETAVVTPSYQRGGATSRYPPLTEAAAAPSPDSRQSVHFAAGIWNVALTRQGSKGPTHHPLQQIHYYGPGKKQDIQSGIGVNGFTQDLLGPNFELLLFQIQDRRWQ